jgi:succinyl-CoA synthetase beta subunit
MNIHEYQAKELSKKHGALVSNEFVIFNPNEIKNKINQLKGKNYYY